MFKTCLLIIPILAQLGTAQFIVYTSKTASDEDVFWKTTLTTPPVSHRISDSLNQHAAFSGKHRGPITTSHNGAYFIFNSERFDTKIDGYEAVTICKSDFTGFEVPRDPSGGAFHSEGIMQISNDGKTIYFVKEGDNHIRDIFKSTKGVTTWSTPVQLSTSSTYKYNVAPYLSYDESKIVFEASNDPYSSTAILEITVSGTGLIIKTSTATINTSVQVKSPCYDINGNIYFEAETDAERIWKMSASGGPPVAVHAAFTNDNSPITLPDGKIASLFLPASTHQIKVMEGTGLNHRMLTQASSEFIEVLDIGISAGGPSGTGIKNIGLEREGFGLRRFNQEGGFEFHPIGEVKDFNIFDPAGREVEVVKLGKSRFRFQNNTQGFYLVRLNDRHGTVFLKAFF